MKFLSLFLGLLLFLTSCAEAPNHPEKESLTLVPYSDLPGWSSDTISEAVPALQRSCAAIGKMPPNYSLGIGGNASDWIDLCARLQNLPLNDADVRVFIESNFQPYAVTSSKAEDGLFTGYYEPQLRGALKQDSTYQTPLYARPGDFVTVDLGAFKKGLKGQHIVGKVEDHKLLPYDDRADITDGSLQNRAKVLAYVDDPIDAFILSVQGSGLVRLQDGDEMRVGFDGTNGRGYVAIGRELADGNLIERPVTMQKIRDYLQAHPDSAKALMDTNPSYVFFKKLDTDGPIGAEGVVLTPRRSLAVDPAFIPLGLPVWLDTVDSSDTSFQHLMVAQDTGGAIKGVLRGDVFWGSGPEAAAQAGAMQSRGHYYMLLPKTVIPYDGK